MDFCKVNRRKGVFTMAEKKVERVDIIKSVIEQLPVSIVVDINNEYCSQIGNVEGWIYQMSEFDTIFADHTPLEIAAEVSDTQFWPSDDWFWFNNIGNLCSSDSVWDSEINLDDIAIFIDESEDSFNCPEIAEVLECDECFEEDEDENFED